MKKKILFYGNCQLAVLARFFRKNLSDKFEVARTDSILEQFWGEEGLFAVWSLENKDRQHDFKDFVHTKIKDSDIFIFQDHGPGSTIDELQTKFLHDEVSTGLKICLPNTRLHIHLSDKASLEPYIQYVKTKETNVSKIIKYLQESDDPKLTEILKQDFPFNKTYQRYRNENQSRHEQDIKNYDVVIDMNNYIEEKYKSKILAYTHNHPTEEYFMELIRRLYKYLDVNEADYPIPFDIDCPRNNEKINPKQFAFFNNTFPNLDISRQNSIRKEADLEKIVSETLKTR